MDFYEFISSNWIIVSSFVTGLIAGNPRTIKRLLGVFTAIFGLYRLFIFLRELKNPAFRAFLFKFFATSILLISIIFFVISSTGCSYQYKADSVTGPNYPDLFEKKEVAPVAIIDVPQRKSAPPVMEKQVENYLASFEKLADDIKHKREIKVNKVHIAEKKRITDFKEERAVVRKSLIVSCNILVSKLRKANSIIKRKAKDFGKKVLISTKAEGISKRQLLKLPLNTCEKFGISFFYRLKHKSFKLSSKWLFCKDFAVIGLIPSKERYQFITDAHTLTKLTDSFKEDYEVFSECRHSSKTRYFNKLKLGLFPSRKLND